MRFYIIIPAHNEENFLAKTLHSLALQSLLPSKIVIVNDHSSDGTKTIIENFAKEHSFATGIHITSTEISQPGSKIIQAFHKGYETLDNNYDIICKLDADLIFPKDYLESIANMFKKNPKCGIAGGFCYIQRGNEWVLENLTNKDHVRGALKAYRKECFENIGGLKKSMGWDTVDELLARYYGWEVLTSESLKVKHLKPTGIKYQKQAARKQGEAFKKMRYGILLTNIAALKLATKKRSTSYYFNCILGFIQCKEPYIVTEEEGKFIRNYRWQNIIRKLF